MNKQVKSLKLELFWFNSTYAILFIPFYYDCNYLIYFLLKSLSQVVSSSSWQWEKFLKARNEINGSCRKKFVLTLKIIITFLKNNLTNICGKIIKIGMNLWMVSLYLQYEELWKVKYEKMGCRLTMYFTLLTKIIRDLRLL